MADVVVINNYENKILFDDIAIGDIFKIGDLIYIKVEESVDFVNGSFNPKGRTIGVSSYFNCVNLSNGERAFIMGDSEVELYTSTIRLNKNGFIRRKI